MCPQPVRVTHILSFISFSSWGCPWVFPSRWAVDLTRETKAEAPSSPRQELEWAVCLPYPPVGPHGLKLDQMRKTGAEPPPSGKSQHSWPSLNSTLLFLLWVTLCVRDNLMRMWWEKNTYQRKKWDRVEEDSDLIPSFHRGFTIPCPVPGQRVASWRWPSHGTEPAIQNLSLCVLLCEWMSCTDSPREGARGILLQN